MSPMREAFEQYVRHGSTCDAEAEERLRKKENGDYYFLESTGCDWHDWQVAFTRAVGLSADIVEHYDAPPSEVAAAIRALIGDSK